MVTHFWIKQCLEVRAGEERGRGGEREKGGRERERKEGERESKGRERRMGGNGDTFLDKTVPRGEWVSVRERGRGGGEGGRNWRESRQKMDWK